MPTKENHPKLSPTIEGLSSTVFPVASGLAAIHELNTHGYIDLPFIEQVPGIMHSSSAAGGAAIGMVGGIVTERIAANLEMKGKENNAEKVRHFGTTITLLGSLATQLTIESGLIKGTPDAWDVAIGFIATAPGIIAGHSLARSNTKNKQKSDSEHLIDRETFLKTTYLEKEYILPGFIEEDLSSAADILASTVPGFIGIVNVGGTSNGSYELRRQQNPKAATDLDFYSIGTDETLPYLDTIATVVQDAVNADGITLDGVLNGRNPDNFLNLDHLDQIVERGDTYLLALPFRSLFGDITTAKAKVLEYVLTQPNKQELWDEIASYHLQSLSMHHGSWPQELSDTIMNTYYPQKVERFELPLTPEECQEDLLR